MHGPLGIKKIIFLAHVQILVKCFGLALLYPGDYTWAIYVSFLYFALKAPTTTTNPGSTALPGAFKHHFDENRKPWPIIATKRPFALTTP
jgi:hypothetical protein